MLRFVFLTAVGMGAGMLGLAVFSGKIAAAPCNQGCFCRTCIRGLPAVECRTYETTCGEEMLEEPCFYGYAPSVGGSHNVWSNTTLHYKFASQRCTWACTTSAMGGLQAGSGCPDPVENQQSYQEDCYKCEGH
jgi:hypothetical protein